ncbi:hypothetical protein HDV00_008959 [Rhizophlyctis rosea]|nr:hypothetical protein HDV00_008959 [Rhizophlyctis rosea]
MARRLLELMCPVRYPSDGNTGVDVTGDALVAALPDGVWSTPTPTATSTASMTTTTTPIPEPTSTSLTFPPSSTFVPQAINDVASVATIASEPVTVDIEMSENPITALYAPQPLIGVYFRFAASAAFTSARLSFLVDDRDGGLTARGLDPLPLKWTRWDPVSSMWIVLQNTTVVLTDVDGVYETETVAESSVEVEETSTYASESQS